MGMTGGLVRATLEEIARLREHPSELPEFLDCGIWAPPNREVRPKGMLGWLLRLTPVRIYENDPDAVPPPGAEHAAIRPNIDLDKAWEPLHFLLTGTALEGEEPACYLACGGEELVEEPDDEQSAYSSIRVLTPEQVAAFDRYLTALTIDELRRRFDVNRMVELRIIRSVGARRRRPTTTGRWITSSRRSRTCARLCVKRPRQARPQSRT